jgi:superfamily II DNA or RNA helicase
MDTRQFFAKKYPPRQWQSDYLEKFIEMIPDLASNPDRGFLLNATPGAGKTDAILATSKYLKAQGLIRWTVVIVTAEPLKKQMARDAKSRFGIDLRFNDIGPDHQFDGEVITIQSLNEKSKQKVTRHFNEVLVCVDEFHHTSQRNSWGEQLANALGEAKYKLFCTGTPFRSDREALRFVNYTDLGDGELQLLPDFNYAYREALRDSHGKPSNERIVRTAMFHQYDARSDEEQMRWAIDGVEYSHRLSDNLLEQYVDDHNENLSSFVEKLRSHRFGAAIDIKFDLAKRMVADAVRDLDGIRQSHHHAAGLVVCSNKGKADAVAKYMREELSQDPVVIYTDADGGTSDAKIKAFKEIGSPHKWIVAVQQVSEGVDIKRIRSIVWLTNKKTHLLFLQILGRAIRWEHTKIGDAVITPVKEQLAHMYMPAQGSDTQDPDSPVELVKFAKQLEEDQKLILQEKERRGCNVCGAQEASFACEGCIAGPGCPFFTDPGGTKAEREERQLLGAGGAETVSLLKGEEYSPDALRHLITKAQRYNIEVADFISMLQEEETEQFAEDKELVATMQLQKTEQTATAVGVAPVELEPLTISEQMENMKKTISQKVGQLGAGIARAKGWRDDDSRRQTIFMQIHRKWTRIGGQSADKATIGDLTAKLRWLDTELVKLTANQIDDDFTEQEA